jgi:hypothetical protein
MAVSDVRDLGERVCPYHASARVDPWHDAALPLVGSRVEGKNRAPAFAQGRSACGHDVM